MKVAEGVYHKLGLGVEGSVQALERFHALVRLMLRHLTNGKKGAWVSVINRGSVMTEFTHRYSSHLFMYACILCLFI